MPTKKDLSGLRFGLLVVVREASAAERLQDYGRYSQWVCRCDCGVVCVKAVKGLRVNVRPSCGCALRFQQAEKARRLFTKHGHNRSPTNRSKEYTTWIGMRARCNNEKQSL